jgi:TPR repeat protein
MSEYSQLLSESDIIISYDNTDAEELFLEVCKSFHAYVSDKKIIENIKALDKLVSYNHINSMYFLAYIYTVGIRTPKNLNKTIELYTKLVELKEEPALYYLAAQYIERNREDEYDKIKDLLMRSYKLKNNLAAYYILGINSSDIFCDNKDIQHKRWSEGMSMGNVASMCVYDNWLGSNTHQKIISSTYDSCWWNKWNTTFYKIVFNFKKTRKFNIVPIIDLHYVAIQMANILYQINPGNDISRELGNNYAIGQSLIINKRNSMFEFTEKLDPIYLSAIQNRNAIAFNMLAAHTAKKSMKKAIEIYNISVGFGNLQALRILAEIYDTDKECSNTKKYDETFRMLCELKDPYSLYISALRCYPEIDNFIQSDKKNTDKNISTAIQIYESIIDLDYYGDINNKEVIAHFKKDVVKEAYHKSLLKLYNFNKTNIEYMLKLANKAVEWKVAKIIHDLATYYLEGKHVEQDTIKGLELLSKAINLNDPGAIDTMATYCSTGLYVTKDIAESIKLFNKAIELGHKSSKKNLEELFKKLNN